MLILTTSTKRIPSVFGRPEGKTEKPLKAEINKDPRLRYAWILILVLFIVDIPETHTILPSGGRWSRNQNASMIQTGSPKLRDFVIFTCQI